MTPQAAGPPGPSLGPEHDRLRTLTCAKWTYFEPDVLPAWVADMDLPPAPVAVDAVRALADRGDFGYQMATTNRLPEVWSQWQESHHGWCPDPAHVRVMCDVMQGVDAALFVHTRPGDGVVLFTPIYPPFLKSATAAGRRVIDCPLDPDAWKLDPERLEAAIDDRTTAILLCDPHNPTGHVFTEAELAVIADVAERYDLLVISDEIWADLLHPGQRHVAFASLSDEAARRTVTVSAASKAFNLAGLRCAVAHVGDSEVRRKLKEIPGHVLGGVGSPGADATLAAWTQGETWLEETRRQLTACRDHLAERLASELPEVGFTVPEATYLAWLNMRSLGLDTDPAKFFLEEARVALSPGQDFGTHGEGFARLNFATTQRILDEIVDRMAEALRRREGTA